MKSVPLQQSKGDDFRPGTAGHSAGMMQGDEHGATAGTVTRMGEMQQGIRSEKQGLNQLQQGLNQLKQMQESTLNQGQQSGLKQGHSGGGLSGLIQAQDVEDSSVLVAGSEGHNQMSQKLLSLRCRFDGQTTEQLGGQNMGLNQQNRGENTGLSQQEQGLVCGLNQERNTGSTQEQTGLSSVGQISGVERQVSGLIQAQKLADTDGLVAGNDQQQQNTLDQVQIGADSARKVQNFQPVKTGQKQAVLPALTTPIVRHHESLRADRGYIKSITPTKVGAFVAKQPRAKGNGIDTTLKEVVRDLQQKTTRLCEAERKFYAQKAKCNFLLQVKRNAKRRLVSSLTREDGSITSSMDEIHYEFLVYYSKLIGTREDVDDFDATTCKLCNQMEETLSHMLFGCPSAEEPTNGEPPTCFFKTLNPAAMDTPLVSNS
ncbi:hypothetical protein M9H77_20963 [Catharanthus roseus]|uniref:Uncharacterized protein n=1 Tax=Catharanthus roseus TaxID=4058 RepID=A0ACC0AN01_CATRO|nr:hypothetical protein M9H77_20963 [Catharanthus roseus]